MACSFYLLSFDKNECSSARLGQFGVGYWLRILFLQLILSLVKARCAAGVISIKSPMMKYIYYKLYQNLKSVKTNDTPATNAMILLSMIHMANIATVQVLLNHYFGIKIKLISKDEIIAFAVFFGIIIYIVNYFLFYKKREEIYEAYKNESKFRSRIGYIILVLYIVISVCLLYYFGSKYPM